MKLAAEKGRGTALPMGLPLLFYPSPLLTYNGPEWVTDLLLRWWTGRLPVYNDKVNCSRCAQGHRSRVHILRCHRIISRLQMVGFEIDSRSIVHPLDQALQRFSVFLLEGRGFR
ncbi:hypothetical protein THASP1DRAFT_23069, partial [Thamnocephalis sphaerospora]